MGRWTQYDEDSTRLPEGMVRIGYDADTQQYTFRDTDGSLWTSAPGCEYGRLTQVLAATRSGMYNDDHGVRQSIESRQSGSTWQFDQLAAEQQAIEKDVKTSWKMLAPFLLLVSLVPVLAYRFVRTGSASKDIPSILRDCEAVNAAAVVVQQGDICWDIAQKHAMSVDELKTLNPGTKCEALKIGEVVCVKK